MKRTNHILIIGVVAAWLRNTGLGHRGLVVCHLRLFGQFDSGPTL